MSHWALRCMCVCERVCPPVTFLLVLQHYSPPPPPLHVLPKLPASQLPKPREAAAVCRPARRSPAQPSTSAAQPWALWSGFRMQRGQPRPGDLHRGRDSCGQTDPCAWGCVCTYKNTHTHTHMRRRRARAAAATVLKVCSAVGQLGSQYGPARLCSLLFWVTYLALGWKMLSVVHQMT